MVQPASKMDSPKNSRSLPRSVQWRIYLGILDAPSQPSSVESVLSVNQDRIGRQNEHFKSLMAQYVDAHPEEASPSPATTKEATPTTPSSDALDPLTAMVMEREAQESRKEELYLRYRKERARRRRGLATAVDSNRFEGSEEDDDYDTAALNTIEKDLQRLPDPLEGQSGGGGSAESRVAALREILYIYSQEHRDMGYRQGMHEIASYVYLVLELERRDKGLTGNPLFEPLMPHAYQMLEAILAELHKAYDASGPGALQEMSNNILSKIAQNDANLHRHLTTSHNIPPLQIFVIRWVRLLFSREIEGCSGVLQLWDCLLSYRRELMRALEVAAAGRILLLRSSLLQSTTNSVDLLMNPPTISDVTMFTKLIRSLMAQSPSDGPIVAMPELHVTQSIPGESIESLDVTRVMPNHPIAPSPKHLPGFSLKNMRETFGQEVKQIRKKVMDTTNEWKNHAAQREQSSGSRVSASSDMAAAATQAIRNFGASLHQNDSMMDSPARRTEISQSLQRSVHVIQKYLVSLDEKWNSDKSMSNPLGPFPADVGNRVPIDVWEALADIEKVQRHLQQ